MRIFSRFFFSLFVVFLSFPSYSSDYGDYRDVIFYNDDKIETISFYKDDYVLLMFWATWCPYCKQQLPSFSLLKERYKDQPDVKFIALSTDQEGYKAAQNYLVSANINNLDVYHDKDTNLFRSLGLRGVPTILLISKDGTIIKSYEGMKYLDIDYLDELFGYKKQ